MICVWESMLQMCMTKNWGKNHCKRDKIIAKQTNLFFSNFKCRISKRRTWLESYPIHRMLLWCGLIFCLKRSSKYAFYVAYQWSIFTKICLTKYLIDYQPMNKRFVWSFQHLRWICLRCKYLCENIEFKFSSCERWDGVYYFLKKSVEVCWQTM